MKLSTIIKKVEDMVISATNVVIVDSKTAVKAIKANHVKKEETTAIVAVGSK